ncbi:hypothetical protein C8F04DRAFT_1248147 [Mycena alexandri]|uniref:Uncharacterized protein n=1 Tax=Mycena alexandri TaxID=1745969 RepID=A0AAD6TI98_9AGAR|nr:hypothetical protein C8F04DRAFT_1248147 [Mycena alexandri]
MCPLLTQSHFSELELSESESTSDIAFVLKVVFSVGSAMAAMFLYVTSDLEAVKTRLDELAASKSATQEFSDKCRHTKMTKDNHLQAIAISEIRPSIGDVFTMPEYHVIPSETKVGKTDFKKLDLPRHIEEWRQSNINLLLQLLPSGPKNRATKS